MAFNRRNRGKRVHRNGINQAEGLRPVGRTGACGMQRTAGAGAPPQDPFRVLFLSFCEEHPDQVRIETQSRGRIRTADDCACIFDAAMKDLPEPERQVAAFYLMSQPGAGEAELQ